MSDPVQPARSFTVSDTLIEALQLDDRVKWPNLLIMAEREAHCDEETLAAILAEAKARLGPGGDQPIRYYSACKAFIDRNER
jgi:hypothetical protein